MELVGDALVQVGSGLHGVIEESISVTSSGERRSKSIDDGSFKSMSCNEVGEGQLPFVIQAEGQLGVMEGKLVCAWANRNNSKVWIISYLGR